MRRSKALRVSRTWWWSSAGTFRSTFRKGVIIGGIVSWMMPMIMRSPKPWMPKTCSSSFTLPEPPESRKESFTPRAAISTGVTATTKWVFDLKDDDVWWCGADIGWITGHSYIVYGPLSLGVTGVMYEGSPDWPEKDRYWQMIAKYGVTVFYTAPTAIRAFMKWGTSWPAEHDLSSLRLLGTVGEPINPEAWMWYHEHIGGRKCPIVDTWWQTETGMILITPLPGINDTKTGFGHASLSGHPGRDSGWRTVRG